MLLNDLFNFSFVHLKCSVDLTKTYNLLVSFAGTDRQILLLLNRPKIDVPLDSNLYANLK